MATDAASSETTAKVLRATAGQVRLQLDGGREVTKRVTVPISAREAIVGTSVPVTVTGTGDRARVELVDGWLDAATPAEKPATKRKRSGGDEPAAAAKPAAKRRRSGGTEPAEDEAPKKAARKPRAKKASPEEAPVASPGADDEAPAPKRRTRSRGAKAEPADAAVEAPVETIPEAVAEDAPVEAATPGEAPSIAEEPKPKRSRSRSRGGRGRKPAAEAATEESPAKADIPVVEHPADAAPAAAPAPEAAVPAVVAPLDPEVLRTRIAAAVDLVRAARAA
jgi:hypothetical protein